MQTESDPVPTHGTAETLVFETRCLVDADKTWSRTIGRFDQLATFHPGIDASASAVDAPHHRRLALTSGDHLTEILVANDDDARRIVTRMEDTSFPLSSLETAVSVSEIGKKQCRVEWRLSFVPDAGKAQVARDALTGFVAPWKEAVNDLYGRVSSDLFGRG